MFMLLVAVKLYQQRAAEAAADEKEDGGKVMPPVQAVAAEKQYRQSGGHRPLAIREKERWS